MGKSSRKTNPSVGKEVEVNNFEDVPKRFQRMMRHKDKISTNGMSGDGGLNRKTKDARSSSSSSNPQLTRKQNESSSDFQARIQNQYNEALKQTKTIRPKRKE